MFRRGWNGPTSCWQPWQDGLNPIISIKFELINIKETLFLNMIPRGGNRPTSCLQPWHDGLDFFCRKENHQKME